LDPLEIPAYGRKQIKIEILDKGKDVFFKDGKCKTIVRSLISNIIPFLDYIATDISTKLSTRIGRIKSVARF
jgi:hypothetical protein